MARELGLAHVWSWGWGFFNEQARDPDKLAAACVWLWAREASLCDVDSLPERFDRDLRAGQIDLPRGVRCVLGTASITTNEIGALARITGDAEAAQTALYARLVQQRAATVGPGAVRDAELAIVHRRFGGSRAAYLAARRRAGATTAGALGAIADALRRVAIVARLRAPAPSAREVREFAATYASVPLREIAGIGAVPGAGPDLPLGLLPDRLATPAIVRALRHAARADAYDAWSERRQHAALAELRCVRDRLPTVGTVPLTGWLPFLEPVAGSS